MLMEGMLMEGMLTEGMLTEGMMMEGILTEGMLMEGMMTEGILTEGILTEGILTEGILTEGMLMEGILMEGMLTEGILMEGMNALYSNFMEQPDREQYMSRVKLFFSHNHCDHATLLTSIGVQETLHDHREVQRQMPVISGPSHHHTISPYPYLYTT